MVVGMWARHRKTLYYNITAVHPEVLTSAGVLAAPCVRGLLRSLWIQPWIEVATFCASCAQSRSLRLPPWQPAPCNIGNIEAALADTDEGAAIAPLHCCASACSAVASADGIPILSQHAKPPRRSDMISLSDDGSKYGHGRYRLTTCVALGVVLWSIMVGLTLYQVPKRTPQ
jgi:hypothetical protein